MAWHLLSCGHRFNEVMSAVLGPLPLDQPPKSKPVTPMFSCRGEPCGQRPQPSPRFTLSRQRPRANSDSRRETAGTVSGLPVRGGVAGQTALGAGEQGDLVVVG